VTVLFVLDLHPFTDASNRTANVLGAPEIHNKKLVAVGIYNPIKFLKRLHTSLPAL
jgi:hypothetical protein